LHVLPVLEETESVEEHINENMFSFLKEQWVLLSTLMEFHDKVIEVLSSFLLN